MAKRWVRGGAFLAVTTKVEYEKKSKDRQRLKLTIIRFRTQPYN